MKDFDAWNRRKIKLDALEKFQHPREGEIWWCRIGVNVGREIYGKGEEFTRPVLVINAEGSGEVFIGIPLSSKLKKTKYSCIVRTTDGKPHTALVYHTRSFDKRRLLTRMYVLETVEYAKVQATFLRLWREAI